MLQSLETFYSNILRNGKKEGFAEEEPVHPHWLPLLLAALTILIIQLLVGKFLWNSFLTRLVPAVQPAEGIIDILAISFLWRLMFA